jgi:hypothetical protein
VPTGAKFVREYIMTHPLYKNDSKISNCLMQALVHQIIKLNHDVQDEDITTSDICKCEQITANSELED